MIGNMSKTEPGTGSGSCRCLPSLGNKFRAIFLQRHTEVDN
jgi:hypothetical protein